MSVEVVMPQMGESITEGTVSKWLKKVGDKIEKDEAILEISTDKVDAEVPSPGAGTLLEIRHQEGETVEVGTVLATIGAETEVGVPPAPAQDVAPTKVESSTSETSTATADPDPEVMTSAPTAPAKAAPSNGDSEATDVVMPQMGESITEGTVSKWLKKVGDTIEKDEALLEISTDKVDAEVPSPAGGTILAIKVQEGETVEVGSVLALVGAEGAVAVPSSKVEVPSLVAAEVKIPETVKPETVKESVTAAAMPVAANGGSNGSKTIDELRRTKSSPLVRNIAKEHGVDITRISGSGLSGRVTKKDILSFIETGAALRPQDLLTKPVSPASHTEPGPMTARPAFEPPAVEPLVGDRVEKMSVMRKRSPII